MNLWTSTVRPKSLKYSETNDGSAEDFYVVIYDETELKYWEKKKKKKPS